MKTRVIKASLLLFLSAAIAVLPVRCILSSANELYINSKLKNDVRYTAGIDIAVFRFPNRTIAEAASEELQSSCGVTQISVLTRLSPLDTAYTCSSEPIIEYRATGKMGDKTKYMAHISNGQILPQRMYAYQLSKELVNKGMLNLVEGRMLDFERVYADYAEIVVNKAMNLSIDDVLYFTVNGMDDEYKQVVIKTKVVGIVENGSFLYGASEYCNCSRTAQSLYNYVFEDGVIFIDDISSVYKYENDPSSLLDEDIAVFLLCTLQDGFDNVAAAEVLKRYEGERVIKNSDSITVVYRNYNKTISNTVVLPVCIFTLLALIAVDAVVVKKLIKKGW